MSSFSLHRLAYVGTLFICASLTWSTANAMFNSTDEWDWTTMEPESTSMAPTSQPTMVPTSEPTMVPTADPSRLVTVNTTYGPVQGINVGYIFDSNGDNIGSTYADEYITAFVGIPFAKPPIDDLRFASPEEPDSWTDTLDVSDVTFITSCIQMMNTVNEDCLYLNVFTPLDAEYNVTSYQVMVWIYGGGFIEGLGFYATYDPVRFIKERGDVIIVSFNYRLGLLGFMYDNDYGTGNVQHIIV